MQSKKVILVSDTMALRSWCVKELAGRYSVAVLSTRQVLGCDSLSLEESRVVVDATVSREVDLCFLCGVLLSRKPISIFLLVSKNLRMECIKSLFPQISVVSVYASCGTLAERLEKEPRKRRGIPSVPQTLNVEPLPHEQLLLFSPEMRRFASMVRNAFSTETSVLLVGESGSGKGFTASLIHNNSSRRQNAFRSVSVAERENCLLESELCGTVRGAFTGAENRDGIFMEAGKGSLLLDEISEMDSGMQGKLLNVLDTRRYRKVGGTHELELTARLLFATDADLHRRIQEGTFRKQLFYRISVLVIEVPPLRKHMADVSRLANGFALPFNKKISSDALKKLNAYWWPGNIRELKNCVERACCSCRSGVVQAEEISFV